MAKGLADRSHEFLKQVAEVYTKLFREIDAEWKTNLNVVADEKKPAPTTLPNADREALRQALYAEGAPANPPKDEVRTIHARRLGEGSAPFRNRIEALSWTLPGAPQKAIALADRANPGNSHVFLRGNPGNPGPEVPRRFLEVLSEPSRPPFTN